MKRFSLAVVCAGVGVLALVQVDRAQVKQAQAPKDLATAVQAGDTKLALQQIQTGADVNKAQPDGTTPLMWAVYRTDYDVAQALLAKKANPNVTNEFGATPLTEAARQDDERLVKMLLDAGAKVDSANPDDETALMTAISAGDVNMVQMLVDHGANVNTVEKFHDQTPLMYAVSANRNAAQMTKILLSKGADVKPRAMFSDWPSQVTSEPRAQYRPVGGLTALLYATRSGCYECAGDLIAAGADINEPTPEGITPLMNALDNEHNDIAKLLMDKGANLDVWDWWGRTALWVAVDRKTPPGGGGGGGGFGRGAGGGGRGGARGGPAPGQGPLPGGGAGRAAARSTGPSVPSMEIINALLNAGVDPNPEMNFHRPNAPSRGRFADNEVSTGTTALFRAVQLNDVEVVEALLLKGADPNINTMGYSPLLLAAGAGPGGRGGPAQTNTQMLNLLLQHKADVNAKITGVCCGPDKLYSFDVSRENMTDREGLSKDGTSALHEAARSARADLVKFLLEHGANPNLPDGNGKKPIDVIGVQRVASNGRTNAGAAAGQAPAQGQAAARGEVNIAPAAAAPPAAPRGGGGARGGAPRGPTPAAIAEVRALLEAAAAKN